MNPGWHEPAVKADKKPYGQASRTKKALFMNF